MDRRRWRRQLNPGLRPYGISSSQGSCLEIPGRLVARPLDRRRSMLKRRILPEAANLIDDGQPKIGRNTKRRHGIQDRGMGVQDIGPKRVNQLPQATGCRVDDGKLIENRNL